MLYSKRLAVGTSSGRRFRMIRYSHEYNMGEAGLVLSRRMRCCFDSGTEWRGERFVWDEYLLPLFWGFREPTFPHRRPTF